MGESMWKVLRKRSTSKSEICIKENKATGHKIRAHFDLTLLLFGTFLAILGVGQKAYFLENLISKINFIILKTKFGTSNYIFSLHMSQIFMFIENVDQQSIFEQNLTSHAVFPIGVPVKNAFLVSSQHFKDVIILM